MMFAVCLFLAFAGAAQLDEIKSEADPNRRAEMAVDAAGNELNDARESWNGGDWTKTQVSLSQMKDAVELADSSLEETGKQPRNNHHYKTVEIKLRNLIRRVDAFRLEVDYEQREAVNAVETRLQQVHDRILDAVMTKRKRS
ncbi:MAG TPA: hypothetical protein VMJ34_22490 [Bryobacteraceae bacterium]|nr:hypothetical protein [Bryobacteraceae bacterium]